MDILTFLVNYWSVIVGVCTILAGAGIYIFRFLKLSKEKQIAQIKAWLLGAVMEAEKEFGSGTGKLKLASVYDKFLSTIPWLAKTISFENFSKYVDDALVEMRKLLSNNGAIATIIVTESTEA